MIASYPGVVWCLSYRYERCRPLARKLLHLKVGPSEEISLSAFPMYSGGGDDNGGPLCGVLFKITGTSIDGIEFTVEFGLSHGNAADFGLRTTHAAIESEVRWEQQQWKRN